MRQATLFDDQPRSLEHRFRQFHEMNPWVFDELVRLTRELKSRGHRRVGIGMLFEVLRWHHMRATDDPGSEFKLNNSYRSRYARLIMDECPDLRGVFETRELRSR